MFPLSLPGNRSMHSSGLGELTSLGFSEMVGGQRVERASSSMG